MDIKDLSLEDLESLCHAIIDDDGKEINNPVPNVVYTGLNRPPTLQEQIKRVLYSELNTRSSLQGTESVEESQDFEVAEELSHEIESMYQTIDMEDDTEFSPLDTKKADPVADQQVDEPKLDQKDVDLDTKTQSIADKVEIDDDDKGE